MKKMTFTFVEDDQLWVTVVTADSMEGCLEKYFAKYPERAKHPSTACISGDVVSRID